ncbi:hypothetical protein [Gandjariella thermophila]|uniref:Sensor domain-containing protein n=1 Tax=Gandjariella thermophila TaxID=1931992 RepID=A0A4D4J1N4_9PSEU|nr:hypothetical protein [Gandjariella thermophila]GDY28992.1 hypothetical protein GTS_06250 [Gandjariella thermophila]
MDLDVVLRPLRVGARMRVPYLKSWGGRSGALIAAFVAFVIWVCKLLVLAFALAVILLAYACLGVAWLLAPPVAAVARRVYRGTLVPSTETYQGAVLRGVYRLNAALAPYLRR